MAVGDVEEFYTFVCPMEGDTMQGIDIDRKKHMARCLLC
jgi:hypothetical protein